jgi:3-mercaptopyruvate sulfurtransferase SseA
VAQYLRDQGYQAFALEGGYQAWKAAGYPLETKEVEVATTMVDICPECGRAAADHLT